MYSTAIGTEVESPRCSGCEKKNNSYKFFCNISSLKKSKNKNWVLVHLASKQIERESLGFSGFEANSNSLKT